MADRSLVVPCVCAALAFSSLARADGTDPAKPASTATTDPPPSAPPTAPPPATEPPRRIFVDAIRPPPLHVEYAQYGVALLALANISPGATCSGAPRGAPCILGSGGGLAIRGGYRSPGPWYVGGAYAFAKMDSSNLYRLGIFQQLWAEMRYLPDTGYQAAPFLNFGLGGVAYGNEWGVETGGAMIFGGGGLAFQITRIALIGLGIVYKPTLIVGWTDTAGIVRPTGVAHFVGLDFHFELRSELGRR